MVPYYVMPAVCMAILASFEGGWARRLTTMSAALAVTVVTFYRVGEWRYYGEMTVLLAVVLIASRPRSRPLDIAVAEPETRESPELAIAGYP
jgi:hypothetical protein